MSGEKPKRVSAYKKQTTDFVEQVIKTKLAECDVLRKHLLDDLFSVNLYLPADRIVLQINAKHNFYPFTYRKKNYT